MTERIGLMVVILTGCMLLGGAWGEDKYAGDFLDMGQGARELGQGGAVTSSVDDATATYWNPAALTGVTARSPWGVGLMHASMYQGLYAYETASLAIRYEKWSLGLGLVTLGSQDIRFTGANDFYDWGPDRVPGTNDPGEGNGVWDPGEQVIFNPQYVSERQTAVFLSAGYPLRDDLSVGAGLKILGEGIGDYSAWGLGLDLGARWQYQENWRFGLVLQDVPFTFLKWSVGGASYRRPTIRMATDYRWDFPNIRSNLRGSAQLDWKFEGIKDGAFVHLGDVSIDPRLGLEFGWRNLLFARAGVDVGGPVVGAGIRILFFQVDYAFLRHDLGNVHRISLTLTGPELTAKEPAPPPPPPVPKEPPPPPEKPVEVPPPPPPIEVPRDDPNAVKTTLLFEEAMSRVQPSYTADLTKLAAIIARNPDWTVALEGHCDARDIKTAEYPSNQVLSEKRAQNVANILIEHGVLAKQLKVRGFGAMRPLDKNDTEAGRAKNRRVEMRVE